MYAFKNFKKERMIQLKKSVIVLQNIMFVTIDNVPIPLYSQEETL